MDTTKSRRKLSQPSVPKRPVPPSPSLSCQWPWWTKFIGKRRKIDGENVREVGRTLQTPKNPVFSSIHHGNVRKKLIFCFFHRREEGLLSYSRFIWASFVFLSRGYPYELLARRFRAHPVFALNVCSFIPFLFISVLLFFCIYLTFGLGKMMKKKIRVSVDPAPSTSFLVGEEARARFKYQCLLQDYQELFKETVGKRERLNEALQRKLKLLAEVKFLTKKYQSLSKIPLVPAKSCRAKKQSCKEVTHPSHPAIETNPPLKERNHKSKEADLNHFKVPLKEMNRKAKEGYVQTAPKLLDLNQASLPNGEEMEFEVRCEPMKMDKLKRSLVEGDEVVDDIKFSACRDIGSSQSAWGTGKFHGKISSL